GGLADPFNRRALNPLFDHDFASRDDQSLAGGAALTRHPIRGQRAGLRHLGPRFWLWDTELNATRIRVALDTLTYSIHNCILGVCQCPFTRWAGGHGGTVDASYRRGWRY